MIQRWSITADDEAIREDVRPDGEWVKTLHHLAEMQRVEDKNAELERQGVHLSHCNFGEHAGSCKYGDDDCPALTESWKWFGDRLQENAKLKAQVERLSAPVTFAEAESVLGCPKYPGDHTFAIAATEFACQVIAARAGGK